MNATIVILLVTLIATAFAWVELVARAGRARRQAKALEAAEQAIETTRAVLANTQNELAEHAKRVDVLTQQLDKLRERQDQLELRDPETGTYVQAIRRVQRGAGADDLVANCGLTRAEAELVLALHGKEHADSG